jgi:adenine deaminase
MSKSNRPDALSRFELAKVALGESNADLAIINGRIVNVYTAEVITGDCILIKGDKIAYVGKYAKRGIGPNTRIIDASGQVLIPGFIEGHTHTDYIYSSHELVRFALKTGTTSIISETGEVAYGLGYRGIIEYLKSMKDQPVKSWITLPPMVNLSPLAKEHLLTVEQIRRLLRRKEVLGLGEPYWAPVVAGDKRLLEIIEETLKAGKKVEGHSAGATANKLQAYTGLGISSDHEPIEAEEALERLRLGLSVMIRDGEIRQDLEAVSRIKDRKIDFRRLALSTDGIGPWQLTTSGFVDHLVQKAINLGFPPVQAIQMGTLNVAEHFNLSDFVGGIAPGRFADIVFIPEMDTIKPQLVISNGQIAMQNGELLVSPRRHNYPKYTCQSMHIEREIKPGDFEVRVNILDSKVKVRVIDQISNLLTKETIMELAVDRGQILMDKTLDIIKIAAIERNYTQGKTFSGFHHGLGLKQGAISTSTAWDSNNLIVAGTNERDMALAVNRVKDLGGGMVISRNGDILAELAFPVGGKLSTEPMEVLAEKLTRLQMISQEMGCTSPDIRTTLSVLTTSAIPYLRICESGLFNLRTNGLVDLVVDEST